MKNKKADRNEHTGKNPYEKEAYRNFLATPSGLDKTEKSPTDINKTSESSFEEEKIDIPRIKKKSKALVIKDFVVRNWVVTTIGAFITALLCGVIILMLTGYISNNREQGIQGEKISTIEKNVEILHKNSEESKNNFNSLKESIGIFKTEVSKDLGFIKKELERKKE